MTRLVVGCGYLGLRAAKLWRAEGRRVVGIVTRAEREAELRAAGIEPLRADVTRSETLVGLPPAETVLWAVGYRPGRGATRESLYVDGLRNVLRALREPPARFILVSTTGVYGQTDGQWVDEQTPCRPERPSARCMLEAEELLAADPIGRRAIVLRLAGLYGPGRVPRLADVLAGRALPCAPELPLNLIHVDDAAAVVLAAERRAEPPRTYLVSDGQPVARREFFEFLASLVGVAPPRFEPPPAHDDSAGHTRSDPGAAADGRTAPAVDEPPHRASDKRVSNARMRRELGVVPRYADYRAGLDAVFAQAGPNRPAEG